MLEILPRITVKCTLNNITTSNGIIESTASVYVLTMGKNTSRTLLDAENNTKMYIPKIF